MKNHHIIPIVCLLITFCCWDAYAQTTKWKPNKARRFYGKEIARQRDPVKLQRSLEEAVSHTDKQFLIHYTILLAEHYERSGDFTSAEQQYVAAYNWVKSHRLPLMASALPDLSGTVFDAYDRLAYFYLRTGNLRKAEVLFQESKTARDAFYPKSSLHRVQPLVGMGSLYLRQGNYQKTYELFDQAVHMMDRAMTTQFDYDVVNRLFLSDLAELCLALGKNTEAIKHINNLSLASSGVGKFSNAMTRKLQNARILELKARYYLLTNDFEKSQEYLDRSNAFYPVKVAASDVSLKLLKTQALLHWYQGNTNEANKSFQRLVQAYRDHIARNFVSMSEYEREQFFNTLKNDLNLFNAYALDIHSSNPTLLYEEIYNNTINTKALLLNTTNRQKNKILQSNDVVLIDKFHQWENSKSLLAGRFYSKGQENIDSLEKKVETLEKDINQYTSLFQERENAATWQQVQSGLKDGEAAIEILRINTIDKKKRNAYAKSAGLSDSVVYGVLLLKPGLQTPEFFWLKEGSGLEKRSLRFYRNSIYAQVEDRLSYNQFWSPIRDHLKDVKRVFISPDGIYNQINLNTLQNPATGLYVIDEIEVVYLTNTRDLLRKDVGTENRVAALFGHPAYATTNTSASADSGKYRGYGVRNVLTEELTNFREQEFDELPGTAVEVKSIEETLRSSRIEVNTYTGADASEENVKSLKRPGILHIATHGFFVDDSASVVNPMIRSGLVLAGVQNAQRKNADDGILTAYEATNLDLESTNLVVLSACQTGLGEIRNGEGVYGLQRAIIVAGAKNLLMSLWKVDDKATAQMMSGFYRSWNGTENLRSFREAQLALRETFPHPFYWGAFIMLGN